MWADAENLKLCKSLPTHACLSSSTPLPTNMIKQRSLGAPSVHTQPSTSTLPKACALRPRPNQEREKKKKKKTQNSTLPNMHAMLLREQTLPRPDPMGLLKTPTPFCP